MTSIASEACAGHRYCAAKIMTRYVVGCRYREQGTPSADK